MDVELTEDQRLFQETTRKFLEHECPMTTVRAWADLPHGFEPAWWRQCAELGFVSLLVSEADGGGSLSEHGLVDLTIVAEECGRLVSPGPLAATNVVAAAVSALGTAEQRDRLLSRLLRGDVIASWDGGTTDVTVDRDGKGFVLRGVLPAVDAGTQAEELLVTALGADGPTQFLVPVDADGVGVVPLDSIDLNRRFARVDVDGVHLGPDAVLGSLGAAAEPRAQQLRIARVLQCAESAGAMDRVLELTVEYMADRYSFGRPLSSYQALKHRVADLKMSLEATHGITAMTARKVAAQSDDAAEFVHAACAYIGLHSTELVHEAVQLHGGIGVTWEHDLHLYLRRVTLNRMMLGMPSHHLELLAAASFASVGH